MRGPKTVSCLNFAFFLDLTFFLQKLPQLVRFQLKGRGIGYIPVHVYWSVFITGLILLLVRCQKWIRSCIICQARRRFQRDLSKRPSNYSLIHFYKRCVSLLFSPGSPGLMLSEGLYDSPQSLRVFLENSLLNHNIIV